MCGCNKGGAARVGGAARSSGPYQYEYTSPAGEVFGPFLTVLEAKVEQRRYGGGTIKRASQVVIEAEKIAAAACVGADCV